MNKFEEFKKKGYDAWVEIWCQNGYSPRASECMARYLKEDSDERAGYIAGWNQAKNEFNL